MFNPKQALQRIRKNRSQKEPTQNEVTGKYETNGPLFPEYKNDNQLYHNENTIRSSPLSLKNNLPFYNNSRSNDSLQERMFKLQSLVSDLSNKLSTSNQQIDSLKKQNNQLQTHILKLEHENSQLKNSQKFPQLKNSLSGRFNNSINLISQNSKLVTSLNNDKNQIKKAESKVIQDQVFSPQVQDAIQQIKKQPIQSILKRKQQNFRALKNASKDSLIKGQKALKELGNLHRNYGKDYKKPTLIINLQDTDFQ